MGHGSVDGSKRLTGGKGAGAEQAKSVYAVANLLTMGGLAGWPSNTHSERGMRSRDPGAVAQMLEAQWVQRGGLKKIIGADGPGEKKRFKLKDNKTWER